jgi:hypothetical protein
MFIEAATNDYIQYPGTQIPSDMVTPDSQPAKKKKKKKNKKKKQQYDAAAETVEPKKPITSDTADDPIDDDPFRTQLEGIAAIKRGDGNSASAQETRSQQHTDIAKSVC